mgnify:CR=1 FL=1
MEQLARILIFLGMLLVNLITTHRCATKKYSITRIIGELTLFTIFIFVVSFSIRIKFDLPYFHDGIVILIGFTSFFILNHLYQESWNKILSIMIFSRIHTMTVTFLSLQISTLFEFKNHFQIALIIQTIIFLFSTPFIIKFIKNKFLYILKHIPLKMNKYLILLSLLEFTTLLIIYLFIVEAANCYWKIITGILVALTAVISYHLIYIIVKNSKSINFLKYLAYTDNLTGIKNRLALFLDSDKFISENIPFTIIYMDLNNFKKVNDTFGHSVGDDYLKKFSEKAMEVVGDKGSIYRMSGDEFVCLYRGNKIDLFLAAFDEKITNFLKTDIHFLGISIGSAKFPQDANTIDELINKADKAMYEVKKQTKN